MNEMMNDIYRILRENGYDVDETSAQNYGQQTGACGIIKSNGGKIINFTLTHEVSNEEFLEKCWADNDD